MNQNTDDLLSVSPCGDGVQISFKNDTTSVRLNHSQAMKLIQLILISNALNKELEMA